MIIQNLESLKSWLTSKLEPICDADPAALAKYVAALVKKDKPEEDLRDVCIDQLEVFLGDKTIPFVGTLFDALKTNSYLTVAPSVQQNKEQSPKVPDDAVKKETSEMESDIKTENETEVEKVIENEHEELIEDIDMKDNGFDSSFNHKPKLEPTVTLGEGTRKRHSLETVNRSSKDPSPSNNNNNNKSLDRDHTRSKYPRKENKDLTDNASDIVKSKDSESRSSSVDKDLNKDSREGKHSLRSKVNSSPVYNPSPERYKRRYPHKHRDHRDYRSDYRDRRGKEDDKPPVRKRGRCKDYEEKGYCIFGESCPYDHGKDPVIVNDINFGVDLFMPPNVNPHLPVPHQLPNVFPRMIPNSSSLMMGSNPLQPLGSSPNVGMNSGVNLGISQMRPVPSPLELPPRLPYFTPRLPAPPEQSRPVSKEQHFDKDAGNEAYNPEQPLMKPEEKTKVPVWMRLGLPKEDTISTKSDPETSPRELITLTSSARTSISTSRGTIDTQPIYVPAPISSTKATSYQRRPFQNQTTLEIRKIPPNLNNVVKLSEHFQKFGKIVNVQVQYDNDCEAALVQFESNFEARRAYTSPEAVFGNRFIKTFWHRGNFGTSSSQNQRPQPTPVPVLASSSVPVAVTSQGTYTPGIGATPKCTAATEETVSTVTTTDHSTTFHSKTTLSNAQRSVSHASNMKLKSDKKKEVMKRRLEIQKQRQNLMEKQIKEQKSLITKLETSKKISSSDKEVLLKAIKGITVSVEKLKKEIEEEAKATQPKTKQTIEKELLDYEMDLFHKMQNGEDGNETRQRIDELRQEAKSLGIRLKIPHAQFRGSARGRRRAAPAFGQPQQSQNNALVDHRPRQLLVGGFDQSEKEAVINNFKELGDVERVEDREGGKLIIVFHTRKQAEMAVGKASTFPGKKLSLAWYTGNLQTLSAPTTKAATTTRSAPTPPPAKVSRSSSRTSVSSLLSKEDERDLLYDLDEKEEYLLLAELEEDDDEDEERSWRR